MAIKITYSGIGSRFEETYAYGYWNHYQTSGNFSTDDWIISWTGRNLTYTVGYAHPTGGVLTSFLLADSLGAPVLSGAGLNFLLNGEGPHGKDAMWQAAWESEDALFISGSTRDDYMAWRTNSAKDTSSIDGLAGFDTLDLASNLGAYVFSNFDSSLNSFTVSKPSDAITANVRNVEAVKFSDGSVSRVADLFTLPDATYALLVKGSSTDEGSIATFTLTTKNVASGTAVPYTISGVSAADILGSLSGTAVVNTSGVATISVTLVNDNLTEGAETLTVTAGGASASTTVNDTSKTVVAGNTPTNGFYRTAALVVDTSMSGTQNEIQLKLGMSIGELSDGRVNGTDSRDTMRGTDGHDVLYAGKGDDTVYGGKGGDLLNGGDGDDAIYGGKDDDVIYGSKGNDQINGEAGNDTAAYSGAMSNYSISVSFIDGQTSFIVEGNEGIDGKDTIFSGTEYLRFDKDSALVRLDFDLKNATLITAVEVQGVAHRGTHLNDIIYGDNQSNKVYGFYGNDRLFGGLGDDVFYGGPGNDFFDDTDIRSYSKNPDGSKNYDQVGGTDTVIYEGSYIDFSINFESPHFVVTDRSGSEGIDTIYTGIDYLSFEGDGTLVALDLDAGTYQLVAAAANTNSSVDVIVDIFGAVSMLKGLIEVDDGTVHTLSYNGVVFNYAEVDPLLTTVVRNGEFTEEFAQEIADAYPSAAGIKYNTVVTLFGVAAVDDLLISVAGADGSYVS